MPRKIRVLVGKPGLDGHDRGAKVVAAALRDAGMEVIYTGLHQSPQQIVEAAVQEDVDVVALSILSGAHMTLFPDVLGQMRERGIGDKLLTGGGIIPPEDMEALAQKGVGRLFGPGSSTQDIADYIRSWFIERHGADSLPPPPSPPVARASVPAVSAEEVAHHERAARAAAARRGKSGAAARAPKPAAKPQRVAKTVKSATAKPGRASKPAKSAKAKPGRTSKPTRTGRAAKAGAGRPARKRGR
jgi:methylmalonyl-CoA mutase C-terminal domain/subunit